MAASLRSHRSPSRLCQSDRVVICGAGPAGLTAAYLLAKQEYAVTVLESDEVVGGISRTAQYKGYRFDIGGHRFFTKIRLIQRLWEEILGEEFIEVPRLSRIHYDGQYFNYPLRASNALRGLGAWNALQVVGSYMYAQFRPHAVEETFEHWVTNRFGARLYEIFFKTYTEKVWGIPCTEIRAEWAAQRIQNLSLPRAILSAASLNRRPNAIKTLIESFHYPRLGPGQMWETCARKIEELGGEVKLGHHVSAFGMNGGRVSAVHARTNKGEEIFEAEHFISTLPLRSLVRAFRPEAPLAVRDAASGLTYRDFLIVALIIDEENLFPDNWIYIHTPGVRVGRIQNFNNWSAAMVPESGKTCLGMEYFCFEDDTLWASSDQQLLALASRELGELGLASPEHIVDGTVIRVPKAYPIYDSAYREHLNAVRGFIDPISNLHTVGRNGMHKYNNQDHSMLTALFAVENMHGAQHDLWAVNTDFEYHEEQRVDHTLDSEPGTWLKVG